MEYKLRNFHGVELHVNMTDWLAMLLLAKQNGWKPCGAIPSWNQKKIVGYSLPIDQKIDLDDAHEFAEALKKGLLTIPDQCDDSPILLFPTEDVLKENPEKNQLSIIEKLRNGTCQTIYVEGEGTLVIFLDADVYFSGVGKRKIEEMVNFCENSGLVMDWALENQYDWGLVLDEDYLPREENGKINFWLSNKDSPDESHQKEMWWRQ